MILRMDRQTNSLGALALAFVLTLLPVIQGNHLHVSRLLGAPDYAQGTQDVSLGSASILAECSICALGGTNSFEQFIGDVVDIERPAPPTLAHARSAAPATRLITSGAPRAPPRSA